MISTLEGQNYIPFVSFIANKLEHLVHNSEYLLNHLNHHFNLNKMLSLSSIQIFDFLVNSIHCQNRNVQNH